MKPDLNPAPVTLKMEKPVYGGDTLAHHNNKSVLVPLTLPGETITATVVESKRKSLLAELDQILTPSTHRVTPPCPYFGACGGCHYQHADYTTQLALKQQILRETLTRVGVPLTTEIATLATEPLAYRNRIRLAITPAGEVGYRSRRSHAIIPIRECPIAAPILVETALNFESILDADPSRNDLAELELFSNHDSSELLVTFHLHSGNQINNKLRSGARSDESFLTYRVANHDYRVPHGAFFQINRHLIDQFAISITANHSGSVAWDLYAGVGLFARRLTESFSRVVAVESAPASREALIHNLANTSAEAISSTTLDYLRRNRELREPRPDLIVLDPPRAGLGPEVTTLLNAIGAPAIVYVSCDPSTLARDLRALTSERYRIANITLADMFPQTFHIETVVQLTRS